MSVQVLIEQQLTLLNYVNLFDSKWKSGIPPLWINNLQGTVGMVEEKIGFFQFILKKARWVNEVQDVAFL